MLSPRTNAAVGPPGPGAVGGTIPNLGGCANTGYAMEATGWALLLYFHLPRAEGTLARDGGLWPQLRKLSPGDARLPSGEPITFRAKRWAQGRPGKL